MGLDVYLYRSKNLKAANEYADRQEEAHHQIYEGVRKDLGLGEKDPWPEGKYSLVSAAQDEWDEKNPPAEDAEEEEVDPIDSKLYPKHYFKVGYLRSSYNDGGINSILRAAIGKDLYTIFKDGDEEEYKFAPDWKASLARAREVRAEYQAFLDKNGAVKIIEVGMNPFIDLKDLVDSKESAMKKFEEEQARHNERFGKGQTEPFANANSNWYSNRDGHYFLGDGARVLAIISGTKRSFFQKGDLLPATYMVMRDEKVPGADDDANGQNWYIAALDITIEMIEYVLTQDHPQEYYFHWSG